MKKFLLKVCFIVLISLKAHANGFITGFEDLPLIPGWEQNHEASVSFDSVGGRIVRAEIFEDTKSKANAKAFYEKTLPQLGWKKRPDGSYIREGERLTVQYNLVGSVKKVSFELITNK